MEQSSEQANRRWWNPKFFDRFNELCQASVF